MMMNANISKGYTALLSAADMRYMRTYSKVLNLHVTACKLLVAFCPESHFSFVTAASWPTAIEWTRSATDTN